MTIKTGAWAVGLLFFFGGGGHVPLLDGHLHDSLTDVRQFELHDRSLIHCRTKQNSDIIREGQNNLLMEVSVHHHERSASILPESITQLKTQNTMIQISMAIERSEEARTQVLSVWTYPQRHAALCSWTPGASCHTWRLLAAESCHIWSSAAGKICGSADSADGKRADNRGHLDQPTHRCFKATPPDIQGLMVLPSGPKCQTSTSTLKLKHETPSASNKDAYRCYFKQGGDVTLTEKKSQPIKTCFLCFLICTKMRKQSTFTLI